MDARPRRTLSRWVAAASAAAALTFASPAAAQVNEPPARIAVSASHGACSARACDFNVSFDAVPGASRYEVRVAAPEGSELISAAAHPGDNSYSVPYTGDGTYLVQVFAYGS